jgi:catechol 2,3-dioxygenase-like lactoylglutathione lyase family enzyme
MELNPKSNPGEFTMKKLSLSLSTALMLSLSAPAQSEELDVQSLLLRSVAVTCKVEDSIAFYRDIMGQDIIEDMVFSGSGIQKHIEVADGGDVRFVIMGGSGKYPGGQVVGGNIAFMAILDPDDPACAGEVVNHRGRQGSTILPHRVSDIEEIAKRAKAAGHEILFDVKASGTGLSRNMMLFDPNGNIVELFQINTARIK